MAAALAATAGLVGAHIHLNVAPIFVANMSGNLIHLGIFAGLGDYKNAGASAVVLAAFVAGVVFSKGHHERQRRRLDALRPGALVAAEAVLVLSLPVLIALFGTQFSTDVTLSDYPVICVAGFAMGIQSSALRRVGAIAVATTYGTGATVRIGEKIGLAALGADRVTQHRRRETVLLRLAILIGYVAGATAASGFGSSSLLLLIPGSVLIAAAFIIIVGERQDH